MGFHGFSRFQWLFCCFLWEVENIPKCTCPIVSHNPARLWLCSTIFEATLHGTLVEWVVHCTKVIGSTPEGDQKGHKYTCFARSALHTGKHWFVCTDKTSFYGKGPATRDKMNFQKNSKWPSTPPLIFGKLCCNYLWWLHICQELWWPDSMKCMRMISRDRDHTLRGKAL